MGNKKLGFPSNCRVTPRELLVGGRQARDDDRYSYATRIHFLLDDRLGLLAGCGGTLISRSVVLTAGHCVALANKDASNVFLRIGAYNPLLDEALKHKYELRRAARIVTHPGYVQLPEDQPTSPNDLALILLDKPASADFPLVHLANETTAYPAKDTLMHAVGWGSTDPDNSQPAYSLQDLDLPAVSLEQCRQQWSYAGAAPSLLGEGHLCAGLQAQRNICFGDSGGPLLLTGASTAEDVQLGITSFSFPVCALPGMPGVFTFIPHYRQWIDEQLAQLDPPPPPPAPPSTPPPSTPPPQPPTAAEEGGSSAAQQLAGSGAEAMAGEPAPAAQAEAPAPEPAISPVS
ncbi:hypothetical protein ABPG75_006102 [Micractinium tetrahymenae]